MAVQARGQPGGTHRPSQPALPEQREMSSKLPTVFEQNVKNVFWELHILEIKGRTERQDTKGKRHFNQGTVFQDEQDRRVLVARVGLPPPAEMTLLTDFAQQRGCV